MIKIIGASRDQYAEPADVARDHRMEPEKQVRVLEKWLQLASARYRKDRSLTSLQELRKVHWTLNFVRRAREKQ